MTAEERLEAEARLAVVKVLFGTVCENELRESLVAAAVGVARLAVAEERERCARLAEGIVDCDCMETVGFCECYGSGTLRDLAAAIRAGDTPAASPPAG